jgi:putative addiction module component (TIGR02574 family)
MTHLEQLEAEVLALPVDEQQHLLESVWKNLGRATEIEGIWFEEAKKRLNALKKGKLQSISASDVSSAMRAKLNS